MKVASFANVCSTLSSCDDGWQMKYSGQIIIILFLRENHNFPYQFFVMTQTQQQSACTVHSDSIS